MIEDIVAFLQPNPSTLSPNCVNSSSLDKCNHQKEKQLQQPCPSDSPSPSYVPRPPQTPKWRHHFVRHSNDKTTNTLNRCATSTTLTKRTRDNSTEHTGSSDDEVVIISRPHRKKHLGNRRQKAPKLIPSTLPPKQLFPPKKSSTLENDTRFRSENRKYQAGRLPTSHGGKEQALMRGFGDPWKHSWNVNHFDFKKKIGSGKFGNVFVGINKGNKEKVALKQLGMKQSKTHMMLIRREIEIHSGLVQNNILRMHGHFQDDEQLYLVLELGKTDLFRYLHCNKSVSANSGTLSLRDAARVITQITTAVTYLNKYHIAHRDIKPENIILQKGGVYKLADFGWAVEAPPPDRHMRRTLCGSPEFVPPEMVEMKHHDETHPEAKYDVHCVDTWALGVLAHELVLRRTPFYMSNKDKESLTNLKGYRNSYEALMEEKIRPFVSLVPCKENASHQYKLFHSFCEGLIQRNPSSRMSAADALHHPWLLASCEQTLLEKGIATQIVTPNPTNSF